MEIFTAAFFLWENHYSSDELQRKPFSNSSIGFAAMSVHIRQCVRGQPDTKNKLSLLAWRRGKTYNDSRDKEDSEIRKEKDMPGIEKKYDLEREGYRKIEE